MASDTSLVFNLVARDRATSVLQGVRDKIGTAAAGIGAAMGVGLGAAFGQAFDLSSIPNELKTQLGVGTAEADALTKIATTGFKNGWVNSSEEASAAVTAMYRNFGKNKFDTSSFNALNGAAKATKMEFAEVTSAAGQLVKTGLAKNASDAADIITAASQRLGGNADDILDTVTEYSTQFRALGLDGQTAMGLISQAMKAGARDTDTVADALKEFTLITQANGTKSQQAFAEIGLSGSQMAADIAAGGDRAKGALTQTLDKLKGYPNKAKQAQLATALFGTKAEDLQGALYALNTDKAAGEMGKVSGAAAKASKDSTTLKDQFTQIGRSVSVALVPPMTTAMNLVQNHTLAFKILAGILATSVVTFYAVSAAVRVWNTVQSAARIATTAWAWAQGKLNLAFLSNPITWVIVAIVALIAVIVLIATKTRWFQTAWSAVWGAAKATFNATWSALRSTGRAIGSFFSSTIPGWVRGGVNTVKGIWNNLVSFFGGVKSAISRAFSGAFNGLKSAFRTAVNWVISMWNGLHFSLPSFSVFGHKFGGGTIGVPSIPYLAKGGTITGAGQVMVGEKGPEVLSLPKGASVTPLSRATGAGGGGGTVHVVFDVQGADNDMKRMIRRMVRVDGRGSVQTAFG